MLNHRTRVAGRARHCRRPGHHQWQSAAVDASAAQRYSARRSSIWCGTAGCRRGPRFTATPGVRRFLAGVTISALTRLDRREALALSAEQLIFMRALHHPRLTGRLGALARLVRHLPGNPMLQRVARNDYWAPHRIGVLRNGVACARVLGFDPRLTLQRRRGDPSGGTRMKPASAWWSLSTGESCSACGDCSTAWRGRTTRGPSS